MEIIQVTPGASASLWLCIFIFAFRSLIVFNLAAFAKVAKMADTKVPAAGLKATLPQIPNVDELKPNEKVWEYQRRVMQAQINKGSRYPPFSIEHMPWERQRLNTPMTDEDRFLRKQWLKDQNLSPNEPRYVAEAKPMCRARRLVRLPWDTVERALAPIMGATPANFVRVCVPRLLMGYAAAVAFLYHLSYNPKTWESHHGFSIYGGRQPRIPGEDHSQFPPEQQVYTLRGFDRRTSHFNARTSAQGQ